MYLSFSVENIITIGIMFIGWMLAIHTLGQLGVNVGKYLPTVG